MTKSPTGRRAHRPQGLDLGRFSSGTVQRPGQAPPLPASGAHVGGRAGLSGPEALGLGGHRPRAGAGGGAQACTSPPGAAVAPGSPAEARLKPNPLFKMQNGPSLK